MAKFKVVTPKGASFTTAGGGYVYEKEALDKAKAAGITITEIADKKPFQDAVKPVWEKYGPKYADMIKRIQAVQ